MPELHKKWQPAIGPEAYGAADIAAAGPAFPPRGDARRLAGADRLRQDVSVADPPPLTLVEDDHFVAAAES